MPFSTVRTFNDPDECGTAQRGSTVELTVTERGTYSAKMTHVNLHKLWMQRVCENLARTSHSQLWGHRTYFFFQTRPGPSPIRNGREVGPECLSWFPRGYAYYAHSTGPLSNAAMSLPVDEMAALASMIGGAPIRPKELVTVTPSREALGRLRHLHEAAGALAEDAPAVLANPEAARGLEAALTAALLDCLGNSEIQEDRASLRQHAAIMRRFHRIIHEHLDEPLYVPELCKALGASERTLRACCEEALGMGPKHYLLLRRMHMVRRTLRAASPKTATVTEIATRYGFWQFGRLAVEYKALFGEAPSATLARPV